MKPNTLQMMLLNTYRGGQFAGLKRGEDLRACGDAVFIGLYNALDDNVILDARQRNMDPALLAAQRLNDMLTEISQVIGHISGGALPQALRESQPA